MCKIAGDSMVVPIVAMAIVAAVISSKQLPVVKHDWDDQIWNDVEKPKRHSTQLSVEFDIIMQCCECYMTCARSFEVVTTSGNINYE